jgi:glyoxylase-like metal-dependent hydrolase (beta-lactamase superfamily II)
MEGFQRFHAGSVRTPLVMVVTRVTPSVFAIRCAFTLYPPGKAPVERFVYAYLIHAEQSCLIDCGTTGSVPEILGAVDSITGRSAALRSLILTHAHPDHIGGAFRVQKASGCTVLAHAAERLWIEHTELQFQERPVPGFHELVGGNVAVDRTLHDGDRIAIGRGHFLSVLHTPGHSRGSISLYDPREGILFTGDAVPVPGQSPIYDDPLAVVRSLHRLRTIAGVTGICPAWQDPVFGDQCRQVLADSLAWVRRVHAAVYACRDAAGSAQFTSSVASALGIHPDGLNQFSESSFRSHLPVLEDPLLR